MRWRSLLACLLIAGLAAVIGGYLTIKWAKGPAVSPLQHPAPRIITIPDGSSFQQVAALLEHERLIKSRLAFILLGRSLSADRKIRSGEYELNAGMPPADILAKLINGQVVLHPVTIPEGLTIVQIGDLLALYNVTDRGEFLRLALDRAYAASLGITAETLEGYLYPDTYKFPRQVKAKEVLTTMVDHWKQAFGIDLRARTVELRMTVHEVMTLASVIEKETGAGHERAEISAVFHNRLRKHIPLQSDPTVIYGLPDFDGNIHKKDLSSPSPYNTYRVQGLPPGPIANPGIQAIQAALYPSGSRALYFVSKNDGTHQFSSTLEQHNEAVEKYQKRPFRRQHLRRT